MKWRRKFAGLEMKWRFTFFDIKDNGYSSSSRPSNHPINNDSFLISRNAQWNEYLETGRRIAKFAGISFVQDWDWNSTNISTTSHCTRPLTGSATLHLSAAVEFSRCNYWAWLRLRVQIPRYRTSRAGTSNLERGCNENLVMKFCREFYLKIYNLPPTLKKANSILSELTDCSRRECYAANN